MDGKMNKKHDCEECKFRAKFDKAPKSLLGRIWRWHANWCPGWKSYMNSLPEEKRFQIASNYKMNQFLK